MFELKPMAKALLRTTGHITGTALVLSGAAMAQQQADEPKKLERVEITGSAIPRVEAETALPVQIITREEIARSGVVNTEQLMQALPAISTMGSITTSLGAGLSIYGQSTVSLRGLQDNRTLVLVNGRRVAAFAGADGTAVNVNAIPLAAIDRIEVLKDGASAIYGSDAIAGVVNFILSRNYSGVEASATAGRPTRSGGGDSYKASVVGGFGNLQVDRFNVTLSVSAEKERQLWSKDRDFAKTGNVEPYIFAGATGQGNIEGAIDPNARDATDGLLGARQPGFGNSPGRGYGNPLAATGNCGAINMYREIFDTDRGFPFCSFDSPAYLALLPDREAIGFTANGAFKVSDSAELFGDALYSKNRVIQRIQPSPLRRSFMVTDSRFAAENGIPALLIRPNNPNYQIAADYLNSIGQGALVGQTLAVTARVFDFGLRTSDDESTQTRLVAGLRGDIANQQYEVAYSHNESKLEGSVTDGYFSQFEFARVVNDPNSDYNPWSLTQSPATTAALAAAKYSGPTLNAKSKSDVVDGKLTGDLFNLPAGMTQYAVGAQYRKEKFTLNPSAALLSGDIAGLGGATLPVDKDRTVNAVFGEVAVPIVKSLDGTVASRWDDYDDVGSRTTFKGSLRWQPNRIVLVRGSIGTGFRAPTLIDLWQPQTLGTSALFRDPLTGVSQLQVNELSGGNPDLKPEKSRQRSLGVIVQPVKEFSFGLDFFRITVKDIITQPSTQEVVSGFRAGNPTYADKVILSPSGDIEQTIAVLVNSGDAQVEGVDVQANFGRTFGFGRVDASLLGTYMSKFDQTSPGGVVSHKVGTTVDSKGDPVLGADTGGVVLRWKHVLSGTYSTGGWAFTLTQNYYRGYEAGRRAFDEERNFIPSWSIYDAQVAYTGIKHTKLALGVKNLFDKNPPGVFTPVSNQFQAGYDVTLYDPRARFVYLTATYKFL